MGIYSWYFNKYCIQRAWKQDQKFVISNGDFFIVLEMFGHVSTDIQVTELMLILPRRKDWLKNVSSVSLLHISQLVSSTKEKQVLGILEF